MNNNKKKIIISIISLLSLIIGILLFRYIIFDDYKGKIAVKNIKSYTSVLSADVSHLTGNANVSDGYDTVKYTIKYTLDNNDSILRNVVLDAKLSASESKYARFKEIKGSGITSTVSEDGIIVNISDVPTNIEQTLELELVISNAPYGFKVRPHVTVKEETSSEQTINLEEITVSRNSIEGYVLNDNGNKLPSIELSLYENGTEIRRTYTNSEGEYVFGNLDPNNNYIVYVEEDIYKKIRTVDRSASTEKRILDIVVDSVDPFNLEINKYITGLKINNNGKEESYFYADETKVLKSIKRLKNLSGSIYYKITIKNTGEIDGTVGSIQDIVPDGLSFDSKKNPGWEEVNGKLYYRTLEDQSLAAYEERTATLVLDIEKTNIARTYINEVIGKSEEYKNVVFIIDGNLYKDIYVLAGETIDEVTIQDDRFSGWYTDSNYTNKYKFGKEVDKNMILYGSLTSRKCKVTFIDEGNTLSEQEIDCGSKISAIAPTGKTGYTFKYWTLNNQQYDFNSAVTEDITLVSYYEIDTYNITYDLAGGNLDNPNPITYTVKTSTFTLNNPTKQGYTFAGWTGSNGNIPSDVTITQGSTGHKSYTANFTINSYTLVVDPNGGTYESSTNPVPINGNYNSTVTIANPTREGYNFAGWTLEGKGTFENNVYTYGDGNGRLVANYTPETYTIDYTLNGGSVSVANPTEYTIESDSITLNNPTKSGYTFIGWTGTDLTNPSTNVTIPHGSMGNRSYTANFSINTYTLTVDPNGGIYNSSSNPIDITNDFGTILTLDTPTRTGYSFAGWTLTGSGSLVENVYTYADGNGTVTANWNIIKYSISYSGLTPEEETALHNPTEYDVETSFSLTNPQNRLDNEGDLYERFTGWTYGQNTETNVTIPAGTTGDITFTANFVHVDPDVYTIEYDLNGGSVSTTNPTSYTKKANDITLNNPSKEGYNFAGWVGTGLTEPTMTVVIPHGSTGDREYTATYTPIVYTITYALNGGTVAGTNPTEYTIESDTFTLINPTKEGYTFAGWTGSNGNTPSNVTIAQGTIGNKTYTANFTEDGYTIEYDLDGGSVSTPNPISYTVESASITLNNPTKEGYNFAGWIGTGLTEPTITVTIPHGSTGNRSYTATYTPIVYTITYDLAGGTIVGTNPTEYTIESDSFTLINPSKEGYTFAGWTGSNGSTPANVTITKGTTGNKTYTANYRKIDYTISYNLDGGSVEGTNPTSYSIESSDITLINPTKNGYTFTGWTGTGLSEQTTTVTIPTGSIGNRSYTATYTPIVYTITYDGMTPEEEATVHNPTEYTIEDNTFTLTNPTRAGYTFIGWTGSNGNNPLLTITIDHGTTGNKQYTANFDINSYTVTYKNGENTFHTEVVSYRGKTTAPSVDPVKSHAYFSHWSLEANGTPFDFNTEIVDNTTLYAVFTSIEEPTITHTPTAWTNQDVTVNVTSSHNEYEYYYKVGDGSYAKYENDFTVSQNTTVYAYSKYGNGQSTEASHQITNIDKIDPSISTTYVPTAHTVDLNMDFQDNESGVKSYEIYFENVLVYSSLDYTSDFNELKHETFTFSTLDASTEYSYRIELTDIAGNVAVYNSTVETAAAVFVARVIGMGGMIYDDPSQFELFESLQAAISYCSTTQCTIQTIPDLLEESVVVAQGQDITLDLDGKVLTSSELTTIENNGNLKIVDRNSDASLVGTVLNENPAGETILNNSILTVGEDDGAVSVTKPLILAANRGIENLGTFNFYDGKVKGVEALYGEVTKTPYSYNALMTTEDNLDVLYLQVVDSPEARIKSKYFTKLSNAVDASNKGDTETTESAKYLSKIIQVGEFGFVYNQVEDSITSENMTLNSSTAVSMLELDLTDYEENQFLTINYSINSQKNYDFGYITILENKASELALPAYNSTEGRILYVSGTENGYTRMYEIEGGKKYYVYFGYYKQDSLSYSNDYFKINSFTLNAKGAQGTGDSLLSNQDYRFVTLNGYNQLTDLSGNQDPLLFTETVTTSPKYNEEFGRLDFSGSSLILNHNVYIDTEETLDVTFSLNAGLNLSEWSSYYALYDSNANEKIRVYFRQNKLLVANTTSANVTPMYTLPSNVNDGNKHRLIVTYNNGTYTPYIDGVELPVDVNYSYDDSPREYNSFGKNYNEGSCVYFQGAIYDFKIYDKVLSETDIDDNLYSGNLKLHYDFSNPSVLSKANETIYAPYVAGGNSAHSYMIFDLRDKTEGMSLNIDVAKSTPNANDKLYIKVTDNETNPGSTSPDVTVSSTTFIEEQNYNVYLNPGQINYVHFVFAKNRNEQGIIYIKDINITKISDENSVYQVEKHDDATYKFNRYYNATIKDLAGNNDYIDGDNGLYRYDYTEKALRFNGQRYLFSSGYSVENEQTVDIEFSTTNTSDKYLYYGSSNEKLSIGLTSTRITIANNNSSAKAFQLPADIYDGNKHRLTATYNYTEENGKVYKLYYDGVELAQNGTNGYSTNANTCIGGSCTTNSANFYGFIYTVKVYDKTLDPTEIDANPENENLLYYINSDDSRNILTDNHAYINNNQKVGNSNAHSYLVYDLTNSTNDNYIIVNYTISSQNNADFGYITVTDTPADPGKDNTIGRYLLVSNSSTGKVRIKLEKGKVNYVHLGYSKNNSTDTGLDSFIITSILDASEKINNVYNISKSNVISSTQLVTVPRLNQTVDTIELLKDVTVDSPIVISPEREVELDINGYQLTTSKGDYVIRNEGTLTIKDSDYTNQYQEVEEEYEREQALYDQQYASAMADYNELIDETLDKLNNGEIIVDNDYFNYSGSMQDFTAPYDADYTFEMWGASGGRSLKNGSVDGIAGKGGYSKGTIHLNAGDKIYVYVGQQGINGIRSANTPTAYNGGGYGTWDNNDDEAAGSGGGATDIRIVSGNWDDSESLASRIMVAGAGGGATWHFTAGYGGGLSGGTNSNNGAPGATQTTGYAFGIGKNGAGVGDGDGVAGGGGGYYGGLSYDSLRGETGSGGSGYVSGHTGAIAIKSASDTSPKEGCTDGTTDITCSYHYSGMIFTDTVMKAGNEEMPTYDGTSTMIGNEGNGYVKVTISNADTSTTINRDYAINYVNRVLNVYEPVRQIATANYDSVTHRGKITSTTYSTILNADGGNLEINSSLIDVNVSGEYSAIINRGILTLGKDVIIETKLANNRGIYNETVGNINTGNDKVAINVHGSESKGIYNTSAVDNNISNFDITLYDNSRGIFEYGVIDTILENITVSGSGIGLVFRKNAKAIFNNTAINTTGYNVYFPSSSTATLEGTQKVIFNNSNFVYNGSASDSGTNIYSRFGSNARVTFNGCTITSSTAPNIIVDSGKMVVNNSTLSSTHTLAYNNAMLEFNGSTLNTSGNGIMNGNVYTREIQNHAKVVLNSSTINKNGGNSVYLIQNDRSTAIVNNSNITSNNGSTAISNNSTSSASIGGNSIIEAVYNEGTLSIGDNSKNYTTVYDYDYTGNVQKFVAPKSGNYRFETWGASGGGGDNSSAYYGGKGAYAAGDIYLTAGTTLYIYVGERGLDPNDYLSTRGTYNGGSMSSEYTLRCGYWTCYVFGGGGGGATDISISGEENHADAAKTNFRYIRSQSSYLDRIIVAGAGGGGGAYFDGSECRDGATLSVAGKACGSYTVTTGTQTTGRFGYGDPLVTAYGGKGSGYFTDTLSPAGTGGTSYVSGYTGSVAMTENSGRLTPISVDGNKCADGTTDVRCSYHRSGYVFTNTVMKSGSEEMPTYDGPGVMIGNVGDGHARITLLDEYTGEVVSQSKPRINSSGTALNANTGIVTAKTYFYDGELIGSSGNTIRTAINKIPENYEIYNTIENTKEVIRLVPTSSQDEYVYEAAIVDSNDQIVAKYVTISDAVNAVSDDISNTTKIVVLRDIITAIPVVIPDTKNVSIDYNGHYINYYGGGYFITNNGIASVINSKGTTEYSYTYGTGYITNNNIMTIDNIYLHQLYAAAENVVNNGTLNLNNMKYRFSMHGMRYSDNLGFKNNVGATINITGGTYYLNRYDSIVVRGFDNYGTLNVDDALFLYDGDIWGELTKYLIINRADATTIMNNITVTENKNLKASFLINYGNAEINDSTIKGKAILNYANLTLSNLTVQQLSVPSMEIGNYDNGILTIDGGTYDIPLNASDNANTIIKSGTFTQPITFNSTGTLTIESGTVNVSSDSAINSSTASTIVLGIENDGNVSIADPSIQGKTNGISLTSSDSSIEFYDGIVKGQTAISGQVSKTETGYAINTDISNNVESKYLVNTPAVKNLNTDVSYFEIKDAFDNASNGDTLQLLRSITIPNTYQSIVTNKTLTLDLNNFLIDISNDDFIVNSGNLTIINSPTDSANSAYYSALNSTYSSLVNNSLTYKTYDFDYSGTEEVFYAPYTGTYKISLWGAQGSDRTGNEGVVGKGGRGAYTSGTITLNKGDMLLIHVGGSGATQYNGGGYSNGGGATDISLESGNLNSRIMVAAGGGAGGAYQNKYANGGAGGALSGHEGSNTDSSVSAQGGTQLAGGKGRNNNSDRAGTFGKGGRLTNSSTASGGGGGYYGGGGAEGLASGAVGGAGGSSYISGYQGAIAVTSDSDTTPKSGCDIGTTDVTCSYHYSGLVFDNTVMKSGNETIASPDGTSTVGKEGNGYARITLISTSETVTTTPNMRDASAYVSEVLDKTKTIETEGMLRTASITPIINNTGTLTINSGMFSDSISTLYNTLIQNSGTLNVNSGVFSKSRGNVGPTERIEGTIFDNTGTIIIKDGSFKLDDFYKEENSLSGGYNTAIYNRTGATTTILGGDFNSQTTAAKPVRGRLFYNDGTINVYGIVSNYSSIGRNTGTVLLDSVIMEFLTHNSIYYADMNAATPYEQGGSGIYGNLNEIGSSGTLTNMGTLTIIGGRYATETQFLASTGTLNINNNETDSTYIRRLPIPSNKKTSRTDNINLIVRLSGSGNSTINNFVFYSVDGSNMIEKTSTGDLNISNSIVSTTTGQTILNIGEVSNTTITNTKLIANSGYAINTNKASTIIITESEITSNSQIAINTTAASDITVESGKVVSGTKAAINNTAAGKLTLGIKADGVVSTTSPLVQGSTYGVYSSNATFAVKFYDGILKGKTAALSASFEEYESGYNVVDDTETIDTETYKTKYLDRVEVAQNMTTLDKYFDLYTAFDEASSGDTIKMINNYSTLNTDLPITINQTQTLDLNGFEINQSIEHLFINNGTFIITDGSLNKDGMTYALTGTGTVENYGTLTIDGAKMQAKDNFLIIVNKESATTNIINGSEIYASKSSTLIRNDGTMTVTDSTIEDNHSVNENNYEDSFDGNQHRHLIVNGQNGTFTATDSKIYSKGARSDWAYTYYERETFDNAGHIELDNVEFAAANDPVTILFNRPTGYFTMTNVDPTVSFSFGINYGTIVLDQVEMTLHGTKRSQGYYDNYYDTYHNEGTTTITNSVLYADDNHFIRNMGILNISNTSFVAPDKSLNIVTKRNGVTTLDDVQIVGDSNNGTSSRFVITNGTLNIKNTTFASTASNVITFESVGNYQVPTVNIINSNITATGTGSKVITFSDRGIANLVSGSLTADGNAINMGNANATVNLGTNDSSYDSNAFTITSNNNGVNITTGNFNFYDGIVRGTNKGVYGIVHYVEDGFRVVTKSEDGYEVAYLTLVDTTAVVAESGGIQFDDLQAAINYAVRNSTYVTLTANIILSSDLEASSSVDLYLAGYTITTGSYNISSNIHVKNGNYTPSGGSISNILGNILGIGSENKEIIIYEMEDGSALSSNVSYRLYKDNVLQKLDEEEAGTYSIGSDIDVLKPIKGRIYVRNVKPGNYKLVGSDNKEITFSVDEDGKLTGNVKEYTIRSNNYISNAKAELVIAIQTGIRRVNYMLIAISLIAVLAIMLLIRRKRED